jgi:CBS domain-containing protein
MRMNSTVKDVMTTHVLWVHGDATYKEMARRLREFRISAFPVVDDDMRVIGVVSEADMLPKEGLDEGEGLAGVFDGIMHRKQHEKAEGITAADLMSSPAVTVSPDDTVEHAARLMYSRGLKRLPVANAAGHLAGIVTRTDILAVFDRPDAEIRKEVTRLILAGQLQDPRRFKVTVKDGIVTLQGEPETADLGRELVRSARHVQGVVSVRDRLVYPEPGTVTAPGFFVNPAR